VKPILDCPVLNDLASLLELYDEILSSHAQAKIISLDERRRILRERDFYLEKYKKLSRKAIFG
jgi:hypothetical protein